MSEVRQDPSEVGPNQPKTAGKQAPSAPSEWWNAKREAAFEALRQGTPEADVSRSTGVPARTLHAWKAHPFWKERLGERAAAAAAVGQSAEAELLESVLEGRTEAVSVYRAILNADDVGKCKECGRSGPEDRDRISAGRELCALAKDLTTGKKASIEDVLVAMFEGGGVDEAALVQVLAEARRLLNDLLRPQAFWYEGLDVSEEARKRIAGLVVPLQQAVDQAEGLQSEEAQAQ